MIAMPKVDKAQSSHRASASTSSAVGSGTRSSSWSAKDDELLKTARAQGLNWNQISPRYFPSKSPNACRKRHERLMERQSVDEWDGPKLDLLAQTYMDARKQMWSILANKLGEKWQVVEQKCMEKGLKNLNQASRAAQRKAGTYDGHDDSGIGVSDLDEEDMTEGLEASPPLGYPLNPPRGPSIQSLLREPYSNQHPRPYPYQPES